MSDDDIEIVEKDTTESRHSGVDDICQLCPCNLRGLTPAERDAHYHSKHVAGQSTGPRPKRGARKPTSGIIHQRRTSPMKSEKKAKNVAQEDVFWYPAQTRAPPDNYTPGVLSILKEALKQSHKKGATRRAILCYERTPHILRESFDMNWGCGYRNFLMACAALMDQQSQTLYFPHLDSPSSPGVRNLQHWIEDAWEDGYDEIGANDLGHRLVDTKTKIGTGELYVAFTSRKIPCVLVDFDLKESSKGFDTLIEWVVNYFTEKPEGDVNKILCKTSPVMATTKMPVIMQYDGHSVTIVGYELGKNDKYSLLVFDPSSKIPQEIRQAALNAPSGTCWASSSFSLTGKGKRRERSTSPSPRKRSRTTQDFDDGVVSIPDSEEEKMDDARQAMALKCTLDSEKVIKVFRPVKHKKKQEYQLLYFTMGDPLSDQEQNNRKVVFAEC